MSLSSITDILSAAKLGRALPHTTAPPPPLRFLHTRPCTIDLKKGQNVYGCDDLTVEKNFNVFS